MDPDEPDLGHTSDYDDGSIQPSEFTSVSPSRIRYRFENGRRYQALFPERYGLPNDDIEQMREGIRHKFYVDYVLDGELHLAPIGDSPQKIVDLGTGAGFWAQEVAEQYPSARVIGTDISPIQPTWVPPNTEFHVEDLEDEFRPWTNIYEDADLIHIRALLPTMRHPQRVIDRSFENLRPGGWIECHEVVPEVTSEDGAIIESHPLNAAYRLIDQPYGRDFGWNLRTAKRIPELLEAAGFVNIQVRHKMTPFGRWHHETKMREMGMFCQTIQEDLVMALLSRPEMLGMSQDDAKEYTKRFFETAGDLTIHACMDCLSVWGQKPGIYD